MTITLTFEITLESDYHINAGYGTDTVDAALHRDNAGLPVLRGTTLSGLLRDGLYRLLQIETLQAHGRQCQASGLPNENGAASDTPPPRFCGQHTSQDDDCPMCRLFGSPRTPKRWRIGSAHPVNAPLPTASEAAARTGGHEVPHVRVNPRTRRAEPGKLFSREEGDARWCFRFTVHGPVESADTLTEAAWLTAAARMVRHLGAGRRRGRGVCEIHLVGWAGVTLPAEYADGEVYLLAEFEKWLETPAAPVSTTDSIQPQTFTPQAPAGDPVRRLLIVRLDEPLLLAQHGEAGNEFQTRDTIPGSVLRGAFAARVAARYPVAPAQAAVYTTFVRLFCRAGATFPMLYPAAATAEGLYPGIPAPRDLLSCALFPGIQKTETSHGAQGWAGRSLASEDDLHCAACRAAYGADVPAKLEALGGYWSLNPGGPAEIKLRKATEMHVHIDPQTQRAAEGELFSYEVLQAGAYFVGELRCATPGDWQNLCILAGIPDEGPITLHLGKANRRGYGQVTLWIKSVPPQSPTPWCPVPLAQRVQDPQAPIVMTLLTDAILTDPWGRNCAEIDPQWLTTQLGVPALTLRQSFCTQRAVDGFNTYLGVPRWRDGALAAGSAVGFDIPNLTPEQFKDLQNTLVRLEQEGIGWRRNEGFGQVAFNHPLYQACKAIDPQTVIPWQTLTLTPTAAAIPTTASPLHVEETFRQAWQTVLRARQPALRQAQQKEPLAAAEFGVVARLLVAANLTSPADGEALISRLGTAVSVLPPDMVAHLTVREQDQARLNFFRSDKGQPGLAALRDLLQQLAGIVQQQAGTASEPTEEVACRLWPIGIQLLADYITDAGNLARTQEAQG